MLRNCDHIVNVLEVSVMKAQQKLLPHWPHLLQNQGACFSRVIGDTLVTIVPAIMVIKQSTSVRLPGKSPVSVIVSMSL